MTRRLADSVTASNLPVGFDLYAGYVNGFYKNYDQIVARFPQKPVIGISVSAGADEGVCLDVESGDATPQQAPAWVALRRKSGVVPWVYCSEFLWNTCQQEFLNQHVPTPLWWIAAYPGPGPVLYPGAIAHQWVDQGPYDESVVADWIPGIDPIPSSKEDEMTSIEFGGQLHVFWTNPTTGKCTHWWQAQGGPWSTETLP